MKKGFTLIELLAIIVILAILTVIVSPIILNMIMDSRESAYEESINSIISALKLSTTINISDEENLFEYKNGKWLTDELKIDGSIPKSLEAVINNDGKIKLAISNGEYCALKTYESDVIIKKIGNKNNDKMIKENYCVLTPATDESCFKYKVSNNKVTITGYYNNKNNDSTKEVCPKDVVIPDDINNNPVTSIGEYAFSSKKLTSIVIPSNITNIGSYAFKDNLLPDSQAFIYKRNNDGSIDYTTIIGYGGKERTNVIIPKIVNGIELQKINENAFSWNAIENILIPDTVTTIGSSAFSLNQLKNITIPNGIITIGASAFSQNNINELVIPNSVTTIGNLAFAYNKLNKLTISNSVTMIDYSAFNDNQLPDSQAFIYKRNNDGSIDYTTIVSYGGKNRDNVIIPDSVTTIGIHSFVNNQLKNITFSSSITNIEAYAFESNQLSNVAIPNTVTNIGNFAFRFNNITKLTIPNSVTNIGISAFSDNSLTEIIMKDRTDLSTITLGTKSFGNFDIANIVFE